MELAASTVAMFAGRASAVPVLLSAGAMPVICRILSPLFAPGVVSSIASAVGNMADNLDARLAFRAHGGVSALVRLLRPDVDSAVQASAASALALLASRDLVVQDSVRYLGEGQRVHDEGQRRVGLGERLPNTAVWCISACGTSDAKG